MKKIICENYEDMSRAAADIFAAQLQSKPDTVFGLATGSTPIGLYAQLITRYKNGELDFSRARSFNLDEYYPMKRAHPQSYYTFMEENLFAGINMGMCAVPNGEAPDPDAECAAYDRAIVDAGGIDLQLLGIGVNGHIGFNEPCVSYSMDTNHVSLTQSTLNANARFFSNPSEQPDSALTMGFGAIFNARHILMLISGKNKASIAKKLFDGQIHTDIPASLLNLHPNVTVILDREAAGE